MNDTTPVKTNFFRELLDEANAPLSEDDGLPLLQLIDRVMVGTPMRGLRIFEGGGRTVIAPRQQLPAVRPRRPIL